MSIAATILILVAFGALFWLGMRSMDKRAQLPPEPEPPPTDPAPPSPAVGRRLAGLAIGMVIALALALLTLAATDALGYRLDPRFGQAFVPLALLFWFRPDDVLGPLAKLWAKLRSHPT